jgi:hypothetical protein
MPLHAIIPATIASKSPSSQPLIHEPYQSAPGPSSYAAQSHPHSRQTSYGATSHGGSAESLVRNGASKGKEPAQDGAYEEYGSEGEDEDEEGIDGQ